uniref:Uncharacterized protein n=1 Tax=Lyngbya confervoides BDU141951 TaxID=1574623 RepID=A0A8T6QU26_9CYAN
MQLSGLKPIKPLFARGSLNFSWSNRNIPKAAFAEIIARDYLPVLWSVHLPHNRGGGPAAFAEETSLPTAVGVFISEGLYLRMLWATKHLANFILPSRQPNLNPRCSKNKTKAAFAEVHEKTLLLVSQQFNRTFRFGDLDNATEPFFQQTRSPPFGAKTPITSGTKVHQDVYDRESRHFARRINLHPVSSTSGWTTLSKQGWHG